MRVYEQYNYGVTQLAWLLDGGCSKLATGFGKDASRHLDLRILPGTVLKGFMICEQGGYGVIDARLLLAAA